jgi:hypothetical protein
MPHGTGISDIVGKYAAEIADLRDLLDSKLKKCVHEFNRLNNYIQSIEDSEMRIILTFRYIKGLCWEQVAAGISPCASGDSVRKAHDRFLSRYQENQIQ